MEKLSETTSSSTSPSTSRRDTQPSRLTTSRPRSPPTGLSNSEPFLRFPLPQGNRQLANWISTSNPDIMRVRADTEDSGLAESTYELIVPADAESHDEHYSESISESAGSLDLHRSDDVHSLADTEQIYDDESLVDEDVEQLSQSMAQEQAVDVHNGDHESLQHQSDGTESEEEAQSRCSLEYTQHSLKTPSILTPEASKIIEMPLEDAIKPGPRRNTLRCLVADAADAAWDGTSRAWDYASGATSVALPGVLFAAAFTLLITLLYPSPVDFNKDAMPAAPSVITATTSVVVHTGRTTPTTPPLQPTTSAKGMGLIPLNEKASDEWLFGAKKPDLQFAPLRQGAILVHVAPNVKRAWLKKEDCVTITATRATEGVKMEFAAADDGFLVKFPKRETYGVVKLLVRTTCRPFVTKAVKVHFGKGILEEAYEMTKNIASDLSGLVPVAAHEAERCLVEARKSFVVVSDTVASSVLTVSDSLLCRLKRSTNEIHRRLRNHPSMLVEYAQQVPSSILENIVLIRRQISEPLSSVPDMKREIQDGILDAQLFFVTTQISAKMWWLKVTGRQVEHDEYGQKAKEFVVNMRNEGRNRIRGLPPHHESSNTFHKWPKRSRRKSS